VLKPVVARYQGNISRIYFRADAGFANPEVYEYLEAEGIKVSLYLMKNDRQLLERRMSGGPTAEKEATQKILMFFVSFGFIGLIAHRFAWSHMPPYVAPAGDALVMLGWLAIFFVFKENTFTSATIELAPGRARTAPDVRRSLCHASWDTDCPRFVVGRAHHRCDHAGAYTETI
jgi:hypothetical protein